MVFDLKLYKMVQIQGLTDLARQGDLFSSFGVTEKALFSNVEGVSTIPVQLYGQNGEAGSKTKAEGHLKVLVSVK